MSVTIGNRRRGDRGVYVGRPAALGNPHPVGVWCPACGTRHTREAAIELYREWLVPLLDLDTPQERTFGVLLRTLGEGRDVALICWCRSEPHGETGPACHADVIRRLLAERATRREGGG